MVSVVLAVKHISPTHLIVWRFNNIVRIRRDKMRKQLLYLCGVTDHGANAWRSKAKH